MFRFLYNTNNRTMTVDENYGEQIASTYDEWCFVFDKNKNFQDIKMYFLASDIESWLSPLMLSEAFYTGKITKIYDMAGTLRYNYDIGNGDKDNSAAENAYFVSTFSRNKKGQVTDATTTESNGSPIEKDHIEYLSDGKVSSITFTSYDYLFDGLLVRKDVFNFDYNQKGGLKSIFEDYTENKEGEKTTSGSRNITTELTSDNRVKSFTYSDGVSDKVTITYNSKGQFQVSNIIGGSIKWDSKNNMTNVGGYRFTYTTI